MSGYGVFPEPFADVPVFTQRFPVVFRREFSLTLWILAPLRRAFIDQRANLHEFPCFFPDKQGNHRSVPPKFALLSRPWPEQRARDTAHCATQSFERLSTGGFRSKRPGSPAFMDRKVGPRDSDSELEFANFGGIGPAVSGTFDQPPF